MIGIIDYQIGNLRSVQKAFEFLGAPVAILSQPDQLTDVRKLVLPGVGAFADGMEHLRRGGWIDGIQAFVESGQPFLGICLGMQLLFESSEEDATGPDQLVPGMSLLQGRVVRFDQGGTTSRRLKVPHMGWNTIQWQRDDPLVRGLNQDDAVYFVHSYYVKPAPDGTDGVTSMTADYGGRFCASIWHENIWATQFHPEKSQRVGLKILNNFSSF